ncbi:MAG: ATP-binding cassette domain-containing protein [Fimbriimonas sp.]|nr:ATP-binding cassette domain-containing protein [Fimbriimonas sp.]
MNLLETKSLTRRFDVLTAVDHVSFAVRESEVFGLVGPNGAGKSTMIKMMTTLLRPTSGTATICGYDIVKQSASVRRQIGYVPQMVSADGDLTAKENLLLVATLYDVPKAERRERAEEALEFMNLADVADKRVRQFSGGMIRRLEIAQSMLHRPKMLFLDEPTVGLDPVARSSVWDHILELRDRYQTTILLTTHLMDEVENLCDRMGVMHHGKMVAVGTSAELKTATGDPKATLDDVFIKFAGERIDESSGFRAISRARRTARRLG